MGKGCYRAAPAIVQKAMDKFGGLTGGRYRLFDYSGHPGADLVIAVMGSAGDAILAAINALNAKGEKLGLVQVRLFRPFSVEAFAASLPRGVKPNPGLDRTKDPGATGG